MDREDTELRHRVRRALEGFPDRSFGEESKGEAAVLVVLNETDPEPRLLLTRRSLAVSTHKGEVAFPGGRREACDESLIHTALRETHEEVGIPPHKFEVVGRLNDYLSVTGWRVTPVISFLKAPAQLDLDSGEVDRAFWVPLRFFTDHPPRVEERRRLGRITRLHFYEYEGEVIWGLTARIVRDLLKALPDRADTRERVW